MGQSGQRPGHFLSFFPFFLYCFWVGFGWVDFPLPGGGRTSAGFQQNVGWWVWARKGSSSEVNRWPGPPPSSACCCGRPPASAGPAGPAVSPARARGPRGIIADFWNKFRLCAAAGNVLWRQITFKAILFEITDGRPLLSNPRNAHRIREPNPRCAQDRPLMWDLGLGPAFKSSV